MNFGYMTKVFDDAQHPRAQGGRGGMNSFGALGTARCPIRTKRFMLCAMNLNGRAAWAQCREEFKDMKECQHAMKGAGYDSPNTRIKYEQLTKDASKAIGDYYMDLTANGNYFKWGRPHSTPQPAVGENGQQLDGFFGGQYNMAGHQAQW